MLGTDVLGIEPHAIVPAGESNATRDTFGSVFERPEADLIFLFEVEIAEEAES